MAVPADSEAWRLLLQHSSIMPLTYRLGNPLHSTTISSPACAVIPCSPPKATRSPTLTLRSTSRPRRT